MRACVRVCARVCVCLSVRIARSLFFYVYIRDPRVRASVRAEGKGRRRQTRVERDNDEEAASRCRDARRGGDVAPTGSR